MVLNDFGKIVAASWDDLSSFYNFAIKLDAFTVTPNHIHVDGMIITRGNWGLGLSPTAP